MFILPLLFWNYFMVQDFFFLLVAPCSMWDLVFGIQDQPHASAVEAQSSNHLDHSDLWNYFRKMDKIKYFSKSCFFLIFIAMVLYQEPG